MNKKYTHLFFDLDNTLWDFRLNSRQAIYETFLYFNLKECGIDFDEFFSTYSEYNDLLWAKYRKKEIHKNELKRQRFQKTFDDLNIEGIDAVEMNDHYLGVMPLQTILVEGALEVLSVLKKRNYRLFIITNGFSEVQRKKMENSGLASFFEKVFISEEVKTPKPGREIFDYAITSTNAKKTKSLMIGDDWEVDVLGAVNNGINAIHFNSRSIKKSEEKRIGVADSGIAEIDRLAELLNLL